MDELDSRQQQALLQLRELTNGADDDVSISVLSTVDWDVQVYMSQLAYTTFILPKKMFYSELRS